MSTTTLLAALAMGAFGSAHCVAMCGGVAGMLSCAVPRGARDKVQSQLSYGLGYNLGRVLSYAAGGLVAGSLGGVVPVHAGQGVLRVLAGITMMAAGLYLVGVLSAFRRVEKLGAPLWKRVEPLAKRLLPVASPMHATLLGMLWGWLPCGMVYAALALAMTAGGALQGGLTMIAFGLGTLPAMLAVAVLTGRTVGAGRKLYWKRLAGVAVVALGTLNLASGLGLRLGTLGIAVPGMDHSAHEHCGR